MVLVLTVLVGGWWLLGGGTYSGGGQGGEGTHGVGESSSPGEDLSGKAHVDEAVNSMKYLVDEVR